MPIKLAISDEATRKLKEFSTAANKASRSSQTSEFESWLAFLIHAHQEGGTLSTKDLLTWLIEDGWSEDKASDLIDEYEFAQDLLRAYDVKRT